MTLHLQGLEESPPCVAVRARKTKDLILEVARKNQILKKRKEREVACKGRRGVKERRNRQLVA